MALSQSVEESLKEAEQCLRNALAYAARQEKPFVSKEISELIYRIDSLIKTDKFMDKIEQKFSNKDGKDFFGGLF